jgi:hypothetical protein
MLVFSLVRSAVRSFAWLAHGGSARRACSLRDAARALLGLPAACLLVALLVVGSPAQAQTGLLPAQLETGALSIPLATPPPRIAARELALRADLSAIRAQARYQGLLSGALIALGCTALALGAVYPEQSGALLFPLGALAISRGVISLSLTSGRTQQSGQYLSLPMYTPGQVRTRIQYGEAVYAYQVRRARLGRLLDGSISLLVAASYVPLAWWLQRRDNPSYHFNDDGFGYVVLSLSAVGAATALVSLFTASPIEQRYAAYRQLVDRQEREQPGELQHWSAALSVGALATRNQLALHAGYRF